MTVSNLTLNTKTYTYSLDQGGLIGWREVSGGVPTGFSKLSNSVRDPGSAKDPVYRMEWRLSLPVVATDDSTCVCDGEILRTYAVQISVLVPPSGDVAERTDFGLRIKDLVATATFQNEIINVVRPV